MNHELCLIAMGMTPAQSSLLDALRARLASRLTALRAIKCGLDPEGLLNPGKLVALAPPPPVP